jgi:hypothetical protein
VLWTAFCGGIFNFKKNKELLFKRISTGSQTTTDVMILKIFSTKKSAKKLAFYTQNKAKF